MRNNNEIAKQTFVGSIRGTIAAIPFVGSAINEFVFDVRGRIKQERFNKFIQAFSEYLSELKEGDLSMDQIEREDFGDFFEAVIIKVAVNHSERKRDAFIRLLAHQLKTPIDIDYSLLFLDIIGDLHERQIPLLERFLASRADCSLHTQWHQILLSREEELSRLQKYKDDEQSGVFGGDTLLANDGSFNREEELKRRTEAVAAAKIEIRKYEQPFRSETYGLDWGEFNILIQDLCNKGLLVDYSAKYRNDPYELVEISALGARLMESLIE